MIEIYNKELVDDFRTYLKVDKNYSNNTIESYIRDIVYFLEYNNKKIEDITRKDIDNYILHILPNYNENSVNRSIAAIKSFYKYLSLFKGFINVSEDVGGAEVWLPKNTDISKLKVRDGQLVLVQEEPKTEEKPKKKTNKEA